MLKFVPYHTVLTGYVVREIVLFTFYPSIYSWYQPHYPILVPCIHGYKKDSLVEAPISKYLWLNTQPQTTHSTQPIQTG